jgi:hypothetical protein
MSHSTARPGSHAKSEDEDAADLRARQPDRRQGVRPQQPAGRAADDGGVSPDEPDEDEFELIGDDDLSPADLGPAAPNVRNPDADSGRVRKITR